MTNTPFLHTENLSIGYASKILLHTLTLQVNRGEMIALLGPNGVGKSTLIKTIINSIPSIAGNIFIDGIPIKELSVRQQAKYISIVLTKKPSTSNITVEEMVSMGRIPYTNWLGQLSDNDQNKVKEAMEMVNITSFANRQIDSLSDGEKQRVMIAKALAQDTPLIILDEPTAHLDVTNRVALLSLLKKLAKETNKAILLSTHELEMAIQVADKIWLIDQHNNLTSGTPEDLAIQGIFGDTFKGEHIEFDLQTGTFKLQHKGNKKIALSGNGILGHWTKQALEKEGFIIDPTSSIQIIIEDETSPSWTLKTNNESSSFKNIEELIQYTGSINN